MKALARRNGETVKFDGTRAWFYRTKNTLPELSRVALKAMHEKAVQCGVPFDYIIRR